MKALILIASMAAVSVSGKLFNNKVNPFAFAPATVEQMPIDQDLVFYSAALKGFIDGYYRGMYKRTNYTVSDACLGDKSMQDIQTIRRVRINNGC